MVLSHRITDDRGYAAATARDADLVSRAIGRATSRTLWRLGPAFVKLGQLLSTRSDLVGPAVATELQHSLALGEGAPDPHGHTQPTLTSGSVADVRRVKLAGTVVAIKSIRAGVPAGLRRDTDLMETCARWLEAVCGGLPVAAITAELCTTIRRQGSLDHELANLKRLTALQAHLPVAIPQPLERFSSDEQLVMTWLDGQRSSQYAESSDPPDADLQRTARQLLTTVFEMLFMTGVVHCDLHPGNWWVMPDGRIAIVDAGFVVTLDAAMKAHFARFFLGMSMGDGDVCAEEALAVAVSQPTPDAQRAFRDEMRDLVSKAQGRTAAEFSLVAFARQFFDIQRRHRAISRSEFVFPITALLIVEGQIRAMDPDLDFQALAIATLTRAIRPAAHQSDPVGLQPDRRLESPL